MFNLIAQKPSSGHRLSSLLNFQINFLQSTILYGFLLSYGASLYPMHLNMKMVLKVPADTFNAFTMNSFILSFFCIPDIGYI